MTTGRLKPPSGSLTDPVCTKRAKSSKLLTGAIFVLWSVASVHPAMAEGARSSTAALSEEDRRLFEANQALAAGESKRALELLEKSAGALDDYRAFLRARALLANGKPDAAFGALSGIKKRAPKCAGQVVAEHPLYVDAVRLQVAILAENEPTAAAELASSLGPEPALLLEIAELHRKAGDEALAKGVEARLLVEAAESAEARALAKQLRPAGVEKLLGSIELRVERVRRLLEMHQNADARSEAAKLLEKLPENSEFRCELHFTIGKAERKMRAYSAATKALAAAREQCVRDDKSELALRAALLEVQVRTIKGELKEARKLIDWMRKEHPAHSFVDDAIMFQANALEDSGHSAAAKPLYVVIAEQIEAADQASEALWRLAYMAFRAGDKVEAAKRLEAILARGDVPAIDRARARYWLARALEKVDDARSRALDEENVVELTFYGWMTLSRLRATNPARAAELEKKLRDIKEAAQSLDSSSTAQSSAARAAASNNAASASHDSRAPSAQSSATRASNNSASASHDSRAPSAQSGAARGASSTDSRSQSSQSPDYANPRASGTDSRDASSSIASSLEYQRARRFHALGAIAYAEAELELLACDGATDDELLSLALAFDSIGSHPRAQALLRSRPAMLSGPARAENLRVWRAAYSQPFLAQIERAAKESKIEPLFLLALSREESTFDPQIVSWAGAVGLAQLMPGTAMLAHLALKLGRLDPERLTDPELNLRLGARVLRDGMKDFGDLEPLALVAYNGGPGYAKKLVDCTTPEPFDRWSEEITIRETRKYVKRVIETWGVYRFLYDDKRPFITLPDEIGGRCY